MSDLQQAAPRLPAPSRLGQATAVEQSRAVAEVHAAIVVAQQCPRDMDAAVEEMERSCSKLKLAERAFYQFPRGTTTVSGRSIYLARELARCFQNIQYGLAELLRDDRHGQSEMLAFAWDVERNTRSSSTFIVPHARDTKDGIKQIVDLRDIYENNANQGARRVREAIFSILPPWFVEQAADLCMKTLKDGAGVPLEQRITDCVAAYDKLGVTAADLEQKIRRPRIKWDEGDVARLGVIYRSLDRGELRVEDEFPQRRVTAAEVTAAGKAPQTKHSGGNKNGDKNKAGDKAKPATQPPPKTDPDSPLHYGDDEVAEGGGQRSAGGTS